MPRSHGAIAKYICFCLQLSESVLEHITDADDPQEFDRRP
jgi:hypothetical protein